MAKQEPYIAIPLAEKGFVSIGPANPVRWYVERPDGSLIGPYADMADADNAAEDLTRQAAANEPDGQSEESQSPGQIPLDSQPDRTYIRG